MGWAGGHLHQFIDGEDYYGPPDLEDAENENRVRLNQIAPAEKARFLYEYDFGDSWEHDILVEKILPAEVGVKYPVCLKGARACPPDDCGGVWGYADLLEALKDPAHPEHKEMLEWIGGELDPEAFDLEEVNKMLQELR